MKHILFFILCSNLLIAQKNPATIFFKNGTSQEGYVFGDTSWELRFSKELKGKKTKYQFEELDSLHITENNQLVSYHIHKYRFGKNQKKTKNLKYTKVQLIVDGPVQLYIQSLNYNTPTTTQFTRYPNGHINQKTVFLADYSQYSLFVKKPNEEKLFWLATPQAGLARNFKKASLEYFQDCPALVSKLESNEFKRKTAPQMIQFYNNNCQ